MATFATRLDKYRGIGPGFDFLRLALSISIIAFHTIIVCYGPSYEAQIWSSPFGGVFGALMPAFFALSGFLVMGSAQRAKSLGAFLTLRGLRIVPALLTEITLSALILGALLTRLPLGQYFTDPQFLSYFGSLIGRIRTRLPGVFDSNPLQHVMNTSLWTIRPELGCYLFLAIFIFVGLLPRRRLMSAIVAGLLGFNMLLDAWAFGAGELHDVSPARLLLLSFTIGNMAFVWRHKLPYSRILFAICLLAGIAAIQVVPIASLAVIPLAYCTVFAGLTVLPKTPLLSTGDYSYGIYLYGFPIQQSVFDLFPQARMPLTNFLIAFPIVVIIAMGSWHFIEKPTLSLRKRLAARPKIRTTTDPVVFGAVFVTLALYAFYLSGIVESPREKLDLKEVMIMGAVGLSGLAAFILSRLRKVSDSEEAMAAVDANARNRAPSG